MILTNAERVEAWMRQADQLINPDQEQQLTYVEEEFYELMYAYRNEGRQATIKEACDLIWVTYGLLLSMGVDPDYAFELLDDSNQSKFPFTKADGKVMKGPNYKKPNYSKL